MSIEQIPGHLYGPARPHIAFYFGEQFLGEVHGHPQDIQAAQRILLSHLDLLDPGNREGMRERVLCATHATVFCGDYCKEVVLRDPTSALWNPLERARQLQRHGHIVH